MAQWGNLNGIKQVIRVDHDECHGNWAQSKKGLWSHWGIHQEMSTCTCQEKLKTRLEMWLWHWIHSSLRRIHKYSAWSVYTGALSLLGTRAAIRQSGSGPGRASFWTWKQLQLHQNKPKWAKQKERQHLFSLCPLTMHPRWTCSCQGWWFDGVSAELSGGCWAKAETHLCWQEQPSSVNVNFVSYWKHMLLTSWVFDLGLLVPKEACEWGV